MVIGQNRKLTGDESTELEIGLLENFFGKQLY